MQTFEIPLKLPSLNDYIGACRRNRFSGARLKRVTDEAICQYIRSHRLVPVTGPAIVHMAFTEPNRRRDVDNVESAKKYILDALVHTGILLGDSPKYVSAVPTYTTYGIGYRVVVTLLSKGESL